MILLASLLLTLVLSQEESLRVSPEECNQIRQRAAHWKSDPSDPYNDADLVYYGIYVGNVCAAHNDSWLDEHGITMVISVAREWSILPYSGKRMVEFGYYPMDDFSFGDETQVKKLWKEISYRMHNHLQEDSVNKILVHCNMGISRSSSVVLWYLQHLELITTPYETIEGVLKTRRPVITPNRFFRGILLSEDF